MSRNNIMVDVKGRTVEGDESEKTSRSSREADENELRESIRLNTFRIYSLQEMQLQLQKEMRRAIRNGADGKTISAIQDEWDRNIRDYRTTVNRIKQDMERTGETGKEAAREASGESQTFSEFRKKDMRKYLEARARAIRAAIGKLIRDLRAKNEQREAERATAKDSTRVDGAKSKGFTANLKESINRTAAAYYTIISEMESTFEKHIDQRINELKRKEQEWEAEKASRAAKNPQDLDQSTPSETNPDQGTEAPETTTPETDTPQPDTATPEVDAEIKSNEPETDADTKTSEQEAETPSTETATESEPDMDTAKAAGQTPSPENDKTDVLNSTLTKILNEQEKTLKNPQEVNQSDNTKQTGGIEQSKNTEQSVLTNEDANSLKEMMMLNGLKDSAEKNSAEYTGKADESTLAANDASKDGKDAKREAEKIAEQEKVDKLHGLSIDEAEKKILEILREQEEAGDSKKVIYQDFDRDGDGKADTRFSIVPNSYQMWNYDNITKELQDRKAKGEKTAGINVNDKRYVNGIKKDEPIDLAIAKATKRAADAKRNMEKASKDTDIKDDKNYSYFISVEDFSMGKDGKVHGGSRNVQYGDSSFAHETASNNEVRGKLYNKLKEYLKVLGKGVEMVGEKDALWQKEHPVLATGRSMLVKGSVKGVKRGLNAARNAFEEGAR